MPSKPTYISGASLAALLLTQIMFGDFIAAGLAAIALASGIVGYSQDRTVIGRLARRFR